MTQKLLLRNKYNKIEEPSYQIKLMGQGLYTKVFKYKDDFYNKNFAIKRAKTDISTNDLSEFKNGFNIMNSMKSPYVVEVYIYDDTENEYYMEYADETIYSYIIKNNLNLKVSERKSLARQIIKSFEYLHSNNVLHRDISFTNVLLFHYGDTNIVKISDFGLTKDNILSSVSTKSDARGLLNDPNLNLIGFSEYSIVHETYALTRLIYFVMTGRQDLSNEKNNNINIFVESGTNINDIERYQNIDELRISFEKAFK